MLPWKLLDVTDRVSVAEIAPPYTSPAAPPAAPAPPLPPGSAAAKFPEKVDPLMAVVQPVKIAAPHAMLAGPPGAPARHCRRRRPGRYRR